MAWDAKWSDIIIEIGCAFAIKDIHDSLREQLHRDLILRIRQLCSCKWKVAFELMPKEANYVAHMLVEMMKNFSVGAQIFHTVPSLVLYQLRINSISVLSIYTTNY
ncbi:hypothetical protein J1N35_043024 [Gossypium stocksii]|uniref:RNase H type-1 domain-containing protein n=1 Tax=Gossypium stocksii TaxID=47602 RepID=A0A9D3U6J1_9ROSI|nr:hypothetical protein J1N35_043024 [Gossypium stocksii]